MVRRVEYETLADDEEDDCAVLLNHSNKQRHEIPIHVIDSLGIQRAPTDMIKVGLSLGGKCKEKGAFFSHVFFSYVLEDSGAN